MCRVNCLWFLLAAVLLGFQLVESTTMSRIRVACDIYDSPCVTKALQNTYELMKTGIENFIDPIDPLYKDTLNGDINDYHYDATNITLSGMRYCEVKLLKFNKDASYLLHLHCPKLVLNSDTVASGRNLYKDLDGSVRSTETIEDYFIIIKGKYKIYISKIDCKPRLLLGDYTVVTEFRGKYAVKFIQINKGDRKQLDEMLAYFNAMGNKVDLYLRTIMEGFLATCMKALNIYHAAYPMDQVYAQDLC